MNAALRCGPTDREHIPAVRFSGVSRHFGEVKAVDRVDLDILDGEFFSMLGPSGCGKTTSLRMIAGFELPTSGEVLIHGKPMGQTPPYQRPVNTVFQSYALFPHMTIGENVAFGLQMKNVAKSEIGPRVTQALEMVRLPGYEKRRPKQMSGGQQQRVALARALVNRPEVLLLDEPLGALDLKLRKEMQLELKKLQREVGITFIYVTHDQEEALTMSDRIAVMSQGKALQVGQAAEIYERPNTPLWPALWKSQFGQLTRWPQAITGSPAMFSVRPEKYAWQAGAAPTVPPFPGGFSGLFSPPPRCPSRAPPTCRWWAEPPQHFMDPGRSGRTR